MLFGVILLLLNFLDGLYKLAETQLARRISNPNDGSLFALSVRLIQLILAFRGGE